MDFLEIEGGAKLSGSVEIGGAKNSALPIIASTILSNKDVIISNLPNVVDIKTMLKLIKYLGGSVEEIDKNSVKVNCKNINSTRAIYEIVSRMRASILVLGPLLSRFGECEVSLPGAVQLDRDQ